MEQSSQLSVARQGPPQRMRTVFVFAHSTFTMRYIVVSKLAFGGSTVVQLDVAIRRLHATTKPMQSLKLFRIFRFLSLYRLW